MKNTNKTKMAFGKVISLGLGLAAGTGLLASCVDDIKFGDAFLEKAPGVQVDMDKVFTNGENAKSFLWSLYGHMRNPFTDDSAIAQTPIEALTDINQSYLSWGQGNLVFYSGAYNETYQDGGFVRFRFMPGNAGDSGQQGMWPTVRKAWLFIENISRASDLSTEEQSRLRGEAYVILATRYFDAFRFFGGLPLVDHAYPPNEVEIPIRATVEETIRFIDEVLIQGAIDEPGLPWRIDNPETNSGRMSKAGAYGLRAKLWQFAASPLFNSAAPYRAYDAKEKFANENHSWLGGIKSDYWQKCVDACLEFFTLNQQNGNYYAMIQPTGDTQEAYRMAFRSGYWLRGNSEKIIEVHSIYGKDYLWGPGAGNPTYQVIWTSSAPTLELMEAFPMADGRNYPYKDIYGTSNPGNVDIMVDRDPRMYETMLVAQESSLRSYMNVFPNIQMWQGGQMMTDAILTNYNSDLGGRYPTGMGSFKWVLENPEAFWHPQNFAYLRMSDMHLTYAEALVETGDMVGALREVNLVRSRVGLPNIETANPALNLTSNKDNLIAEILRERICEFAYEDSRYFDVVRRKIESAMGSPVHELITWRKNPDGTKMGDADNNGVLDTGKTTELQAGENWPDFIYEKRVSRVSRKIWGEFDAKWYLEPLPRSEINKEYGLTQNPGW